MAKIEKNSVIDDFIAKAKAAGATYFEFAPLSGFHRGDLPAGYSGGSYFIDQPELPDLIAELLEEGWTLSGLD